MCRFLTSFGHAKSVSKIAQNGGTWGPKDALDAFLRRVGGRGGRPGKGFSRGFTSFGHKVLAELFDTPSTTV